MSNYDDFIGHIKNNRPEQALTYLTADADGAMCTQVVCIDKKIHTLLLEGDG